MYINGVFRVDRGILGDDRTNCDMAVVCQRCKAAQLVGILFKGGNFLALNLPAGQRVAVRWLEGRECNLIVLRRGVPVLRIRLIQQLIRTGLPVCDVEMYINGVFRIDRLRDGNHRITDIILIQLDLLIFGVLIGQFYVCIGMQLAEYALLRLYLEGYRSAVLRDIADVPGQNRIGIVYLYIFASDAARYQLKRIGVDGVHHHSVRARRDRFHLVRPLGQNILQLVGIVLAVYIDVMLRIGCQTLEISAGVFLQRNADGVHRGAGSLQRLRLLAAVPVYISARFARQTGCAVGNKDDVRRTGLICTSVQPVCCLLERCGIVGAAVGAHAFNRADRLTKLIGQRLLHLIRLGVVCASLFAVMRETDHRNAVVAFLQDILRKFLAHCLRSLDARFLADLTLALVRDKQTENAMVIYHVALRAFPPAGKRSGKFVLRGVARFAYAALHRPRIVHNQNHVRIGCRGNLLRLSLDGQLDGVASILVFTYQRFRCLHALRFRLRLLPRPSAAAVHSQRARQHSQNHNQRQQACQQSLLHGFILLHVVLWFFPNPPAETDKPKPDAVSQNYQRLISAYFKVKKLYHVPCASTIHSMNL